MILDRAQIPDMITKRRNSSEIDRCNRHDKRASMHTEAFDKDSDIKALQDFRAWAARILSPKKIEIFNHLLTLPLATVDITEGIFNEIKKVFDAHNRVENFNFNSPGLENDIAEYRKQIRDGSFWQTDGFLAMTSAINSFIIVDLPSLPMTATGFEQLSDRPTPYYYLLDVDRVIDVEITRGTWRVEYIVFKDQEKNDVVYVFDDAFFRTYTKSKSNEWVLTNEAPHDLGYTPARSFWSTPYTAKSKIQKLAPISKSLAALDQLLFSITLKRHLELYAGFPIYQSYEQKCSYIDEETGIACEGGILYPAAEFPNAKPKPCPKCSEGRGGLGPGSMVVVPGMADKDDPDMLDGIKVVGAEKDSLDYNQQECERQIEWITYNIIGIADELTKEAVNEKQVQSNFESRQTVLMNIKSNFETIHKWTLETICRLRYGKQFVGCTIDYGSQFFLHTTAEILEAMEQAKTNGLPNYELANIRQNYTVTKYRNNTDMIKRLEILAEIEPFIGYSVADLKTLKDLTTLDERQMLLKIQFDHYIRKFERENVDVVSFMQFSDLHQRIDLITEKLLEYVDEDLEAVKEQKQAERDAEMELTAAKFGGQPGANGNGSGTPPFGKPKPQGQPAA